jgi:hypothetical protein
MAGNGRILWALLAATAATAAATGAPPAARALSNEIPKGIEWVNDWDKALATAAERGVPVLISFANDD